MKMSADLDQTPRSLLVSERSTFQDQKNRVSSQVEQLHLNYKVSMLLPDCGSAPHHLDSVLKSFSSFYLIKDLPIHQLLDQDFLESAVYQGSVYGVSYRTRIDEDNCVALTPKGHLCLSLDKDSFEVLGVEGKPSRFNHRTNSRFIVSVDLTDSCMAPGGRGYERLLTGLRSRLQLKTDFLLSHHPGGGASLQALLSRFDWSEHRPEISCRTLTQLSCPAVLTSDLLSCDPHSFLEWLGAVDAHVSSENSASSFLSSFTCPEPMTTVSRALNVSVCGLLLPQDIHRLIQHIRSSLEQPHLESWASLTVHGFVDSPVSWGDNEHGVLRGGDNFYSLLMVHDQTYYLHQATGAHDTCPP
ncbi:ribonuclease P protein subunit p40 [Notolabrus celidotus]|uniref:ribonuclease P protein subunit p40 n=1 Tax=Notolabrus celidotus TaxID=1203425 RepID=UPI00148F5456|nr:ribonuclease P protein subunit p40 [Notolabrus celidotus]XP_034534454.1 ribonuclease P protein subunit p40 [Notolabrus celidotus]